MRSCFSLHLASSRGNDEAVEVLLEHGANPNGQNIQGQSIIKSYSAKA